jgi:hypothetical protein
MQTSLRCKRAIVSRKSLNVDLTVDENLTLKSFYHYLMKLYKNLSDMSTIKSTSNGPSSSLTRFHLKLAYIAVIPMPRRGPQR